MRLARPPIAFAVFVTGLLLVLLVDVGIARIVGVPLIFAGILLGVAAIATPEFLAGDRDRPPGAEDEPRSR
jgi:hypothetical protein